MTTLRTKFLFLSVIFGVAVFVFSSCRAKRPVAAAAEETTSTITTDQQDSKPIEADSDGDGIVDSKDNCPNKAGTSGNNGCPETPIAREEKAEPSFNYQNILFEFNSSVLKTSSYQVLDAIAREMKRYPGMNFSLNGHSSAEGSLERNLTLSNDRATAVKAYLVGLGISSNNLEVKSFGESVPISSNDTEAGRQLNRRVEIKRKF